jgi:hemerythrin-like domain-containing protein
MYGLSDDIQELREEIKKLKEERETLRQKLIEDLLNWLNGKRERKRILFETEDTELLDSINKRFGTDCDIKRLREDLKSSGWTDGKIDDELFKEQIRRYEKASGLR